MEYILEAVIILIILILLAWLLIVFIDHENDKRKNMNHITHLHEYLKIIGGKHEEPKLIIIADDHINLQKHINKFIYPTKMAGKVHKPDDILRDKILITDKFDNKNSRATIIVARNYSTIECKIRYFAYEWCDDSTIIDFVNDLYAQLMFRRCLPSLNILNVTGIPGSGKTTLLSKFRNHDEIAVIDTDDITDTPSMMKFKDSHIEAFDKLYNIVKDKKIMIIAGVTMNLNYITDTKIVLDVPTLEIYRRRINREWDRFNHNYSDIKRAMLDNSINNIDNLDKEYYRLAAQHAISTPVFLPPIHVKKECDDYMEKQKSLGYTPMNDIKAIKFIQNIIDQN